MYAEPVLSLIERRYSCRAYDDAPVSPGKHDELRAFIAALPPGPFGSSHRFELVAALEGDSAALKGLGTYGFIKRPAAFVVGVLGPGARNLEDFGYQMELVVLKLTELGLGNCWLGGSFARGRFARAVAVDEARGESVPAVLSVGNIPADDDGRNTAVRRAIGAASRKPWAELFFEGTFGRPLGSAGDPARAVLEAVRRGPSASNKQPWRLVAAPGGLQPYHLYLSRSPGYSTGLVPRLLKVADIQRADMGIAMAHLELSARSAGFRGSWTASDPGLATPDALTEFSGTWS